LQSGKWKNPDPIRNSHAKRRLKAKKRWTLDIEEKKKESKRNVTVNNSTFNQTNKELSKKKTCHRHPHRLHISACFFLVGERKRKVQEAK